MKIRTITTGIPSAFSREQWRRAAAFNHRCRERFEANGYDVQTTRLSTQAWNEIADVDAALELDGRAVEMGVDFCSLGTLFPDGPQTPMHLEFVAEVIAQSRTLSASVTLTTPDQRIAWEVARKAAAAIQAISHHTAGGFGNMRFAALMNCPPNIPFFPAAYWQDARMNFGIGWQAADLVYRAFADAPDLETALREMAHLMEQEGTRVVALAEEMAQEADIRFVGLDVSPAPMGDESIAAAIEAQLPGKFGAHGTLTVAGAITRTLQSLSLPRCGYSGLMLPILEDRILGERSREGGFSIASLLLYAAVCGIGLDTIPIPGETPLAQIGAILTDVASLSIRWRKPLSARLFPIPGRRAGEFTRFDSPYLTNTAVMAL